MPTPSRLRPAWLACLLTVLGACALGALPARAVERGPLRKVPAPTTAAAETEARVIVKFKADSTLMRALAATGSAPGPQHAQALSARTGLALTDGRTIGARAQVLTARGISSRELAARIAGQADVEYAVVDGRMQALATPNDARFLGNQPGPFTPTVGQWYLRAPTSSTIVDASSVVSAINTLAAWNITNGRASVVIAVLDTGVRFDHPDLAGKMWPGYDFITDPVVSTDGDGRDADASDPGDFGCSTGEATSSWHGTQTAGLIGAATNNGIGMAGAGRDVMLLPVRVLGKCGGFDSDIQAAMLWAAGLSATPVANDHPAKVINLSLGSAIACSTSYQDVIGQVVGAGIVVVAAAGNEGLAVGSPASCPGVIAVAGLRHAGTKVGYSDLGPEIAIAAPAGNCVNLTGSCLFPLLTTSNSGSTTPVTGPAGATYTSSGADASLGTSFSAPLVAGTVGLMFSVYPALTPAEVLDALRSTARAFPASGAPPSQQTVNGPFLPVNACAAPTAVAQNSECYCTTSTCGAGMLDAGAAVAKVATIKADIAVASSAAVVGSAVTLDASRSRPSVNASISSYRWAITSGAGLASFTSATNAASATLLPSAAGTVVLGLTVTDSAGQTSTTSVTLSVAAAPPPPASSGGGALPLGWLLGWLAAVIALRAVTPRRRD